MGKGTQGGSSDDEASHAMNGASAQAAVQETPATNEALHTASLGPSSLAKRRSLGAAALSEIVVTASPAAANDTPTELPHNYAEVQGRFEMAAKPTHRSKLGKDMLTKKEIEARSWKTAWRSVWRGCDEVMAGGEVRVGTPRCGRVPSVTQRYGVVDPRAAGQAAIRAAMETGTT